MLIPRRCTLVRYIVSPLGRSERALEEANGLIRAIRLCLNEIAPDSQMNSSVSTVMGTIRGGCASIGGVTKVSLRA